VARRLLVLPLVGLLAFFAQERTRRIDHALELGRAYRGTALLLGDVIEALAEGLILIGPEGRYELTNRAEEELLGVPRERIIGTSFDAVPWSRLTADGAPFRVEDHPFARLRRGEPIVRDYELQLVSPEGRARTVLASAVPLRDGETALGEAVFLMGEGAATLAEQERVAILGALAATGGRLAAAAQRLGISRTTLWRRLRAYGIERHAS